MDKQEETNLIPEESQQNKGIVQSAKEFMNGVLSPLKGKDVNQMVEDFTAEMTLVAEGMSEDQEKLFQESERLSAQQTELEQRIIDGLHDADVTMGEMKKEISALKARLDKAEKQSADKKDKKGVTAALRQATWLVGIAVLGWITVTLIHLIK